MVYITHRSCDIGFACVWNEEKNIRGWARMMQRFCERVAVIIDPVTDDDTERILRAEFPDVEIHWQDRSLGDSDYYHEGPRQELTWLIATTEFMQKEVDDGDWVLYTGVDGRFHPNDFYKLDCEIGYAKSSGKDGLIHGTLYEFTENLQFYTDFSFVGVTQVRFFEKVSHWEMHPKPHHCRSWFPENALWSKVPYYHFPLHRPEKFTKSWAYTKFGDYPNLRKKFGKIPMLEFTGQMFDWQDTLEVYNNDI